MAKLISEPVTVTIEHGNTRATYSAHNAIFAGDLDGGTNIDIPRAKRVSLTTKPPHTVWSNSTNAFVHPTLTPTISPQKTTMIQTAKAQERATLQAARLIEKAQEQAEALINDADHVLNSAIQAYLHTGKTTTEVTRVLDSAGLTGNEDRTEQVARLETDALYHLDATELLTVG
jgi:cell division septum initiation protein DivIVA